MTLNVLLSDGVSGRHQPKISTVCMNSGMRRSLPRMIL